MVLAHISRGESPSIDDRTLRSQYVP